MMIAASPKKASSLEDRTLWLNKQTLSSMNVIEKRPFNRTIGTKSAKPFCVCGV